jgi:hypothetical protein
MVTIGMSHRQSNLEEFVRPSEETEMPRSRSTAIQSERTRPLAPRLDLARQLDRPAEKQEFLGQRGLAGVRLRNDRKGAPAGNFVGQGAHLSALAVADAPAELALTLDTMAARRFRGRPCQRGRCCFCASMNERKTAFMRLKCPRPCALNHSRTSVSTRK